MDQLSRWQHRIVVGFAIFVMLVPFVPTAGAQTATATLDNPFDTDITGVFEFEVGCTASYGIDGGWSYAWIYLTIDGEPQ